MLANKKIAFLAIVAVLFACISLSAQNTNSPYSRYGYGVLNDRAVGASRAMGGISYGIRNQQVNPGNPASYAGVDSLTFIFDMGVSYSKAKLSDGITSQYEDNGGLDYIALLFPLSKRVGFSAGILPYTSVGYKFGSIEERDATYQQYFSGSGGLSRAYGGIAYEPINGLSVGANVSYLFGNISHSRSLPRFSEGSAYTSSEYVKLQVNGALFDVGIQYEMPLQNNNKFLTLGVVYTPKVNPSTRFTKLNRLSSGDTVVYVQPKNVNTSLPHTIGFGFTLSNKKTMTVGADVTYQKWSGLDYPSVNTEDELESGMNDGMDNSNRFNNRWRFNLGGEYCADPLDRSYAKRMKFRGGLNYSNSYLNAKEESTGRVGGYKEYGATVGFGFPMFDSYTGRTSYINLSLEYTLLNPEFKGLIKEQYFGVTLNVNFNDFWFFKNKFR